MQKNVIFKDEESLVHAVPNYVLPAEIYEEVTVRIVHKIFVDYVNSIQ